MTDILDFFCGYHKTHFFNSLQLPRFIKFPSKSKNDPLVS